MSHEEFFKDWGNWAPQMVGRYDERTGFRLEELYQAFRERLVTELNEAHERNLAEFSAEIVRMQSAIRHAVNGTEP